MVTLRRSRKLRCKSNGRFHLTVIRRGPIHAQQLLEPIRLLLSICRCPRGGCGKGSPRPDGDDIILERNLSSGGSTPSHAVTPIPEGNHHQGAPTLRCNCNFERGARRETTSRTRILDDYSSTVAWVPSHCIFRYRIVSTYLIFESLLFVITLSVVQSLVGCAGTSCQKDSSEVHLPTLQQKSNYRSSRVRREYESCRRQGTE